MQNSCPHFFKERYLLTNFFRLNRGEISGCHPSCVSRFLVKANLLMYLDVKFNAEASKPIYKVKKKHY